jgi:hypothetical protein
LWGRWSGPVALGPMPGWPSTGPGTGLGRLALRKRVGNLVVRVIAGVVRIGSLVVRVIARVVNRGWEILKQKTECYFVHDYKSANAKLSHCPPEIDKQQCICFR